MEFVTFRGLLLFTGCGKGDLIVEVCWVSCFWLCCLFVFVFVGFDFDVV